MALIETTITVRNKKLRKWLGELVAKKEAQLQKDREELAKIAPILKQKFALSEQKRTK